MEDQSYRPRRPPTTPEPAEATGPGRSPQPRLRRPRSLPAAPGPTAAEDPRGGRGREQPHRHDPADLQRPVPRDRWPRRSARAGTRAAPKASSTGQPAGGPPHARRCRSATIVILCRGHSWRRPACSTAKLEGVEKLFDEPTLEAAQRRFHGGIGLAGAPVGGGLGQRLHGPQLPRRRDRAPVRLPAGTGGRVLHDRYRRHPLQRGQQVPPGRVLLRRADLAEYLRGAERRRTSRRSPATA